MHRHIPNNLPAYDPFVRGSFPVGVRTIEVEDKARGRIFPCEVWYPASAEYAGQDTAPETQDSFDVTFPPNSKRRTQMAVRDATARPGTYPLVIFSHSSGGDRRQSTFLCTHLTSHGYVVAAMNHSEIVAPELARKDYASHEQREAGAQAWIANRVPDVRLLLDHLLASGALETKLDPAALGIVGHSFGGWTALATPEVDARIRAVVALAPAGASQRKPGILPATLSFAWGRDVPTLYLVAENDTALPLAGMYELFERTLATKRIIVLRRADHLHFMDSLEELHETVRKMAYPGSDEMRPIIELCSGKAAYLFSRGLTVCHMDATLKDQAAAQRFGAGDIEAELEKRGINTMVCSVDGATEGTMAPAKRRSD
jgi:dienelactone hydrolase